MLSNLSQLVIYYLQYKHQNDNHTSDYKPVICKTAHGDIETGLVKLGAFFGNDLSISAQIRGNRKKAIPSQVPEGKGVET